MKNDIMDIVEGLAPSEAEKSQRCGSTSHFRRYGLLWEREKQGKPLDVGENLD
jgi:hypothetical protein